MLVPVEEPLPVSGPGGQGDDLGPFGQPRLGGVGSVQRRLRGGERVGERCRVADPARDLDRLVTYPLATLAGGSVAERGGQAREQLDAQRCCPPRPERTARPRAAGRAARRSARAPIRTFPRSRAAARASISGSRPRSVRARRLAGTSPWPPRRPRPALRVRQRQQQLAAVPGGRGAVRPERLERHLVQAHRLLVREECDRAGAGALRVVDRLLPSPPAADSKK